MCAEGRRGGAGKGWRQRPKWQNLTCACAPHPLSDNPGCHTTLSHRLKKIPRHFRPQLPASPHVPPPPCQSGARISVLHATSYVDQVPTPRVASMPPSCTLPSPPLPSFPRPTPPTAWPTSAKVAATTLLQGGRAPR